MATIDNLTPKESIKDNLANWCFEVGSEHEHHTYRNAKIFSEYMVGNKVVDFGSGDGAANKGFPKGTEITAVDINQEKLDKNTAKHKVCQDFVTYLESVESIDNLFMNHTLEHTVQYKEVLKLLAQKVKHAVLIAVPSNDYVHSSHHVAFGSVDEIVLPGFDIKIAEERAIDAITEYIFIGVRNET